MKYIAYGSNMNLEAMAYRCPYSKPIKAGYISGWRLYFNDVASIEKADSNIRLPVVMWEIDERDWDALDRYEGYPDLYRKETIKFENEDCIVYIMNDDEAENKYYMPWAGYLATIAQGYSDFDLDIKILNEALEYTKKKGRG